MTLLTNILTAPLVRTGAEKTTKVANMFAPLTFFGDKNESIAIVSARESPFAADYTVGPLVVNTFRERGEVESRSWA